MSVDEPEKLDLRSHDIAGDKRGELLQIFPEVRTEGGLIDFDRLKLVLGEAVDIGKERYGMTWPGKADCFKAIQAPSMGTLLPCPEESINWETTENLLIEGDNLEVLKLLQKSYLGKVKMIYIDPPYNTGNDFIYPDNYSESLQTYLEYTGQVDAEGKKFNTNSDTNGRFHSKWLNMMYPRLYLARNLLQEDGVLFISIDENEVDNLRKLCNEIFGEENHVEDLVWAQNTTHSQSPLYSTNHEYVIAYARNVARLQEKLGNGFREPKPGFDELMALVAELNPQFPSSNTTEDAIAQLMASHKADYEAQLLEQGLDLDAETERQDPWRGVYPYRFAEYRDDQGNRVKDELAATAKARLVVWQSGDCSAPAAKQAVSTKDPASPNYRFYQPTHPMTNRPCPHPKTGWRWPQDWPDASRETFKRLAALERIAWGADELTVPRYKRFIHEVETNIAKSFFYDFTDGEKQVAELLGSAALYPNPKPTTLISRLLEQTCGENDLVLDFFAGSGTTAHAVLIENARHEKNLRFLLVQLPEPIDGTNKDQEAAANFCDAIGRPRVISEITKERVRRAITKVEQGVSSAAQDRGFKAFKLAESNLAPWQAAIPHDTAALVQQLELHIEHVRADRKPFDVLFEILLKNGFPLAAQTEVLTLADKQVYSVAAGNLLICLEDDLTLEALREMAELGPQRVTCLDAGFAKNDQLKANASHLFGSKDIVFKTV